MSGTIAIDSHFWLRLEQASLSTQRTSRAHGPKNSIHTLYGYPARFSPFFAGESLNLVSNQGDSVLDPFAGSGTTLIEALRSRRRPVGIDLSPISAFVIERILRSTPWTTHAKVIEGSLSIIDELSSSKGDSNYLVGLWPDEHKEDNEFQALWKILEEYVYRGLELKGEAAKLIKLIALSAGQAAIEGRKFPISAAALLEKLSELSIQIPHLLDTWNQSMIEIWGGPKWPEFTYFDQADAATALPLVKQKTGGQISAIVCSPPYPSVHMLYAKWQLRGRRETHLPAYIVGDGARPEAFYTLGARGARSEDYFGSTSEIASQLYNVLKDDGLMIQMLGFKDIDSQLDRYLDCYTKAGFELLENPLSNSRVPIWRQVPSRKWHANQRPEGDTSKEAVLVFKK